MSENRPSPTPSSDEPVEGRPDLPEPTPGTPAPDREGSDVDGFPGYGQPPPDVRKDSPPHVPLREWGNGPHGT